MAGDLQLAPYWWDAYRPGAEVSNEIPASADVAVIGGGYAGLSTARTLAEHGATCVVLDAHELGSGASTRNGGGVSGALAISKGIKGPLKPPLPDRVAMMLAEADDAMTYLETLIARESIDCGWQANGRFVPAWTRSHFDRQQRSVESLNSVAKCDAYMVPRERQREEIGSDFYHGGMVMGRSACLHPALYFKGLLSACVRHGAVACSNAEVRSLQKIGSGWSVETVRGAVKTDQVVVATNAYTGMLTPGLRRRVVPIASHMIATEELPAEMARALIPRRRALSDTRRVVCYFRMSPDGRRLLFGGRARFTNVGPTEIVHVLHGQMTSRFPELLGFRITHTWSGKVAFTFDHLPHIGTHAGAHFLLGCNGAGVAMMTYLGHQVALKILGRQDHACSFDTSEFPTRPLYSGDPWFLPMVGTWYQLLDHWDRHFRR